MLQTLQRIKGVISVYLVSVFVLLHLLTVFPTPVLAQTQFALPNQEQLSDFLSGAEKEILEKTHQASDVAVIKARKLAKLTLEESSSLAKLAVEDAQKLSKLTQATTQESIKLVENLLTNKKLVESANYFSNMTSGKLCQAYSDSVQGIDQGTWNMILRGGEATWTIAGAIHSASIAGAGSLTGYAGLASTVSQLGLGNIMTTVAGLMGSNVAGAAATSVVTASVGGPVVMGAMIAGGLALTEYGVYELARFGAAKFSETEFSEWADTYCTLSAGLP
jgi:hypothetical protein